MHFVTNLVLQLLWLWLLSQLNPFQFTLVGILDREKVQRLVCLKSLNKQKSKKNNFIPGLDLNCLRLLLTTMYHDCNIRQEPQFSQHQNPLLKNTYITRLSSLYLHIWPVCVQETWNISHLAKNDTTNLFLGRTTSTGFFTTWKNARNAWVLHFLKAYTFQSFFTAVASKIQFRILTRVQTKLHKSAHKLKTFAVKCILWAISSLRSPHCKNEIFWRLMMFIIAWNEWLILK